MDMSEYMSSMRQKGPYTQILLGAAVGLLAGFVTMKIGKSAAITVGSGILLLEMAHLEGFIKFEWTDMSKIFERNMEQITNKSLVDQAKNFAASNMTLTVAFIGGAFIGIGLS